MNVATVAQEIVEELSDPEVTLILVTNWIMANVGKVSALVGEAYVIVDNEYSPEITNELSAVIKAMYYSRYYKRKSTNSLSNAYGQILSMKDDSSQVTFVNANEISKSFHAQARMYKEELDQIVAAYRQNRTNSATYRPESLTTSKNTNHYALSWS